MSSRRLPRLVRGLARRSRAATNGYSTSTPAFGNSPWAQDPTYHRIRPPKSRQWAMPSIPANVQRPLYSAIGGKSPWNDVIPLAMPIGPPEWYDEHLADGMRNAGRRTAECLAYAVSLVKPGITTREIDRKVTEWAFSHSCYPSSLNYGGFPGSLCTSVNNVISHGVPNDQLLIEGDIINLDIALYVQHEPSKANFHGDTSTSVAIGESHLSQKSQLLLQATKDALREGIEACGPFKPYNGIGKAISRVAREHALTVVPELSGHGIGREYHQYPLILHVDNEDPGEMVPGTIFTIEPCLTEGDGRYIVDPDDKWSLYSVDEARAAQEEHTVMITETGVEILTRRD